MRMSRPAAFCAASEVDDPGTRIMSPNVVMMTPSILASAIAWSISRLAVTQTGQPGPLSSLSPGRHNGTKTIAADAHGMRAADFHKVDGAVADKLMNAIDELQGQLGVAKCRKVDTGVNRLSRRH